MSLGRLLINHRVRSRSIARVTSFHVSPAPATPGRTAVFRLTQRLGVVLIALAVGACHALAQTDAVTAPVDPDAPPSLSATQEAIEMRYRRFEGTLEQLSDYLRKTDTTRAELLLRAIGKSKQGRITDQFKSLTELLKKDQLGDAVERQELVVAELQSLLELLMSEARKDDLEQEKKRVQDLIKDVNKLIGRETDARANTERGANPTDLQNQQKEVSDATQKLVDKIRSQDAAKKAGKSGSESEKKADPPGDKTGDKKSEENDTAPDDKNADDKNPEDPETPDKEGSEEDPKEGEQPSSTQKNGKPSKGSGKSKDQQGQKKPADAGNPSDKDEEPKPEEGKDDSADDKSDKDEESPKPDDAEQSKDEQEKPPEGKPQAGKQGKPKSGKPKSGKPQQGKPQEGKPQEGESQEGESPPEGQDQQDQQDQQSESPESESGSQKKPEKTAGREEVERARQEMDRAIEELKRNNRKGASDKQDKAIAELMKAKEKLEEILRQLREEEREMVLAQLEARFRDMLQKQETVNNATLAIHAVPVDNRTDRHRNRSVELARNEEEISLLAAKALTLLKEEGSSVAFPEAVEQIRDDMLTVARRLERVDVAEITQNIEEDIVEGLREIIEALQKEIEKAKDKKQQEQQQQQQQQEGQKELVNKLAELKMLRSLQYRVNRRTKQLGRMVDGEQALEADILNQLKQLSDRQSKVQRATYDLSTGKNQ